MSVPNEPIVPPKSPVPGDGLPRDPDCIPGEAPPPDPQPDEPVDPMIRTAAHCPTWGVLCRGVRLQTEALS